MRIFPSAKAAQDIVKSTILPQMIKQAEMIHEFLIIQQAILEAEDEAFEERMDDLEEAGGEQYISALYSKNIEKLSTQYNDFYLNFTDNYFLLEAGFLADPEIQEIYTNIIQLNHKIDKISSEREKNINTFMRTHFKHEVYDEHHEHLVRFLLKERKYYEKAKKPDAKERNKIIFSYRVLEFQVLEEFFQLELELSNSNLSQKDKKRIRKEIKAIKKAYKKESKLTKKIRKKKVIERALENASKGISVPKDEILINKGIAIQKFRAERFANLRKLTANISSHDVELQKSLIAKTNSVENKIQFHIVKNETQLNDVCLDFYEGTVDKIEKNENSI